MSKRARIILFAALIVAVALLLKQSRSASKFISGHSQPGATSFSNSTVANTSKTSPPDLPQDLPSSSHPVERAVATGKVMDAQLTFSPDKHRVERARLVSTSAQPRPVRVIEEWNFDLPDNQWHNNRRDMYLADQVIVRIKPGADNALLELQLESLHMRIQDVLAEGLVTVRLATAELNSVPRGMEKLQALSSLVELVEPDGVGFGAGIPNDPNFTDQWGLNNTGQSGGVVDADMDAPEFWDIMEQAPGVVIAVLDSGLNFTHPDLQGVAWVNPLEIPGDGIDNDASGKIDDINGWDFVNSDNDPTDDHGHGSNVSGIITANRNNSVGISGLIGGVRILVCKILNSSNSGSTSNLIAATTYARGRGVRIMNMSLQSYPFSSTLNAELTTCQTAGILLLICAGNQGTDNDTTPNYPSCYSQANIIAVGNHDRRDVRWADTFNPSNYGLNTVDLFAPGRSILGPILGAAYSSYTGTSQAAPHVTAMAAAIKYVNPSWNATEIKACILNSVVLRDSYSGICVTGGRLNALNAIGDAMRQLPNNDTDGDGWPNLVEYLAGTRVDAKQSKPAISSNVAGGFLNISFPRIIRADAHFMMEQSGDLSSWSSSGITDLSTPTQLIGKIPVSGNTGFLRIKTVPTP